MIKDYLEKQKPYVLVGTSKVAEFTDKWEWLKPTALVLENGELKKLFKLPDTILEAVKEEGLNYVS